MKNILLLVHDDEGQEARLQAALDVTRALNGHLTCLDVMMIPMLEGVYVDGFVDGRLVEEEITRGNDNRYRLEERLVPEDVSWSWQEVRGDIASEIAAASTMADLVVLNCGLKSAPFAAARDLASKLLTKVRVPVLAVPATLSKLGLDRALIAWDGQASVASTVKACMPLLAKAAEVVIFTVRDGSTLAEPAECAAYLSRHGVNALIREIVDQGHFADSLIARECEGLGTDYVVMGAYSHGRMMEAFGGVTKRLLANSKIPLILGH